MKAFLLLGTAYNQILSGGLPANYLTPSYDSMPLNLPEVVIITLVKERQNVGLVSPQTKTAYSLLIPFFGRGKY